MLVDANGLLIGQEGSMTTITGRRVNPLTMTAADVDIEDIAHALSRICRYNGHVVDFLSVARHSLWVADRLRENKATAMVKLCGLMHDAAEAYLGDMIRPLKRGELGVGYMVVEQRLEEIIADKFGMPFPFAEEVKEADRYVLVERELPAETGARSLNHPFTPDGDKQSFLNRFESLSRQAGIA